MTTNTTPVLHTLGLGALRIRAHADGGLTWSEPRPFGAGAEERVDEPADDAPEVTP